MQSSDKISTSLELMSFEVKFMEDTIPRDTDLVLTEAKNLLQSLIQIEDVNTFQIGNHLQRMFKAHTWKLEMNGIVLEVDGVVARNGAKTSSMLRGLELTTKFLDDGFED